MEVKGKQQKKPKGKQQNMLRPPDGSAPVHGDVRPPTGRGRARRAAAVALHTLPVLFVPFSAALLRTLYAAERELGAGTALGMSPASLMFVAGMAFATLFCVAYRNSIRLYIIAHEITHALFGWISGAKVSGVTFAKFGGRAKISKSNMMILLSPYFVPFYAFLLVMIYSPVSLFIPMPGTVPGRAYVFFIGLAWGHHFWWTVGVLWQLQPDLREYGRFFSVNLVLFANLLALNFLFSLFSPVRTLRLLEIAGRETDAVFVWIWDAAAYLFA